jgi:hypothetical protein
MKIFCVLIFFLYCASSVAQTLTENQKIAEVEARIMPHWSPSVTRVTPTTPAFQSGYPEGSYNASLSPTGPGSGVGVFGDVGGPDVMPRSKSRSAAERRRDRFPTLGGTRIGSEYPGDSPPVPAYGADISSQGGQNYITDPYEGAENLYTRGN